MFRQLGQTLKVLLAVVAGEDGLVVQVVFLLPVLAAARLTVLGIRGWNIWTGTTPHTHSFRLCPGGDGHGDADVPTGTPLALMAAG